MNKVLKELFYSALYVLFVLGMVWFLLHYVGQRTVVEGTSMLNTLQNNDSLWVDKLTYRFNDPERFDIVVFPYQYKDKTYYIKRVIGLPGETVKIDTDGNIYINGTILSESYGREVISPDRIGRAYEEITLGEDEYFVMGDNRNCSIDSRWPEVGNVKRGDLIGKAVFRMFPFSSIGKIE